MEASCFKQTEGTSTPLERTRPPESAVATSGSAKRGTKMVAKGRGEALAIARLIGSDRTRTVGWVYLWDTAELAVLWLDACDAAAFIHPPLRPEVLAEARSSTPGALIDLLAVLSHAVGKNLD